MYPTHARVHGTTHPHTHTHTHPYTHAGSHAHAHAPLTCGQDDRRQRTPSLASPLAREVIVTRSVLSQVRLTRARDACAKTLTWSDFHYVRVCDRRRHRRAIFNAGFYSTASSQLQHARAGGRAGVNHTRVLTTSTRTSVKHRAVARPPARPPARPCVSKL